MCNSMKARMEGKKFDSLLNVTYIDDSGILLTESSLRASRAKVLKLWKLEHRVILKSQSP